MEKSMRKVPGTRRRAREAWTRATARAMASVIFVTVTAASAPVGAEARVGAVETPTPTIASRREWTRGTRRDTKTTTRGARERRRR